jgi:hypothetical protein
MAEHLYHGAVIKEGSEGRHYEGFFFSYRKLHKQPQVSVGR